jgi:hypothetical protein
MIFADFFVIDFNQPQYPISFARHFLSLFLDPKSMHTVENILLDARWLKDIIKGEFRLSNINRNKSDIQNITDETGSLVLQTQDIFKRGRFPRFSAKRLTLDVEYTPVRHLVDIIPPIHIMVKPPW